VAGKLDSHAWVYSWDKIQKAIKNKTFEGKDPFEGKQVESKGLPAGGTDKRGAYVKPNTKTKASVTETEAEF